MTQTISGSRALPQSQRGFREGFKIILRSATGEIRSTLLQVAGSDGLIDQRREARQAMQAGEIIQRVFVASDGRTSYADDGATPLSPYAKLVNQWVAYVTARVVKSQRDWMQRNVPEDVFNWLAGAGRPENISEMLSISARMLPGFLPNALAEYDPLHRWLDPNGYRLSDRVWRAGFDTRQRLDAMIADMIRQGRSALEISNRSEQFMLPGRAALRTNRPYGRDASYRGMVLGRTEITAAHGRTTIISARLNPYVTGMDWALSASHPKMDICDAHATIGMGGGRIKEPYDLYGIPAYPPHPACLCNLQPAVTSTPAQVTDQLRDFMNAGESPPLSPAADDTLMWILLGSAFYQWWQRNREAEA